MVILDPRAEAELIESIHAPWRATVERCLFRWASLDVRTRSRAFLVVDLGAGGRKQTFNGADIAKLANANI